MLGVVIILLVIAIPSVVLVRRLRQGDQGPGGSDGRQLSRKRDDWGHTSG